MTIMPKMAAMSGRAVLRDIVWVLALKAVALTLLYFAFFAPGDGPAVTADRIAARILTTTAREPVASHRKD